MSFLFAGTFLISNSLNEILNIWIPFFFTAASLIVIIQWAKDRNLDKKFLFFIPVLFLTNTLVQFYGSWNLLQESLDPHYSLFLQEHYLTVHCVIV